MCCSTTRKRSLIDFVATANLTSSLTLVLNADAKQTSGNGFGGNDATTHINGFAAYVNYAVSDPLRVSVRTGYLNYVGSGHAVEGTLTVGYSPVKNFELGAELHYDKLSEGLFDSGFSYTRAFSNDEGPNVLANNKTEFALQGVYKFSLP